MNDLTHSELRRALNDGTILRLEDGGFSVEFVVGMFGAESCIKRAASPESVAQALRELAPFLREPIAEIAAKLSGLTPEGYVPDAHSLGAVVDRRIDVVEGFSFFSEAVSYQRHRVLVRLNAELSWRDIPEYALLADGTPAEETLPAGALVWLNDDRNRDFPPVVI